jgi:hypothetical protein
VLNPAHGVPRWASPPFRERRLRGARLAASRADLQGACGAALLIESNGAAVALAGDVLAFVVVMHCAGQGVQARHKQAQPERHRERGAGLDTGCEGLAVPRKVVTRFTYAPGIRVQRRPVDGRRLRTRLRTILERCPFSFCVSFHAARVPSDAPQAG